MLVLILLFSGLAAWIAWRNSDANLPMIAQGMRGNIAAADSIFKGRVTARYPVGSSEQRTISDLKRQGFAVKLYDDPHYWRGIGSTSRPIWCGGREWDVRWYATRGKITKILGVYGANCL